MPINKDFQSLGKKSDGRAGIPRRYQTPASPPSFNAIQEKKGDGKAPPPLPAPPLTFHHVIPWNAMREVWNYLVQKKAWDTLWDYLILIRMEDPIKTLEAIQAKNEGEDRDILDENLTWPAWNLVQGPRARHDDPESGYENFTRASNGLSLAPEEAPYLKATETLGVAVKTFLDALKMQENLEKSAQRKKPQVQQSSALQAPALPSSNQPDDKKKLPLVHHALMALQRAFELHQDELSKVEQPLYYIPQMWTYRDGKYSVNIAYATGAPGPIPTTGSAKASGLQPPKQKKY